MTRKKTAAIDNLVAEELADVKPPPADKLAAITSSAIALLALQRRQLLLTAELAEIGTETRRLTESVLPSLMDEAQIKLLQLDDETVLTRLDEVFTSISKADAQAATDWLVANGYGSLVKMGFAIAVDKGDVKLQEKVRKLLAKARIGYDELCSVHPQTLKAFGKESVEQGRKLPATIKVHIQPIVKVGVNKPKRSK